MTVTFAGGIGTIGYGLMSNPGNDRSPGVCQPSKKPSQRRLETPVDVNKHFVQLEREVERMKTLVEGYRKGRREYRWNQLKSMCDCLTGQIRLLDEAGRFLVGKDNMAGLEQTHKLNVSLLQVQPRR